MLTGSGLFAAADGGGLASGAFITTCACSASPMSSLTHADSGEVLARSEGVTREDVYTRVSELTYRALQVQSDG